MTEVGSTGSVLYKLTIEFYPWLCHAHDDVCVQVSRVYLLATHRTQGLWRQIQQTISVFSPSTKVIVAWLSTMTQTVTKDPVHS